MKRIGPKQEAMYIAFANYLKIEATSPIDDSLVVAEIHSALNKKGDLHSIDPDDRANKYRKFVFSIPEIKKAALSFFTSTEFSDAERCPMVSDIMCNCNKIFGVRESANCLERKMIAALIKAKHGTGSAEQKEFEF